MSTVYVVTNQHGQFLNKHKEWLDGREPRLLFRSPHKDEAINLVFEMSTRDVELRAEAIAVELDNSNQPVVEVTAPPAADTDEPAQEQPQAQVGD